MTGCLICDGARAFCVARFNPTDAHRAFGTTCLQEEQVRLEPRPTILGHVPVQEERFVTEWALAKPINGRR